MGLLNLEEVGHVLLYMVRRFVEEHCTCGIQASSIHDHTDRCSLKYEVARYLDHAVDRQAEAARPTPTPNQTTIRPIARIPTSVMGASNDAAPGVADQ